MMEKDRELIEAALAARHKAYTPYSHWQVGAALLSEDGEVFTGCNIENAAYTPTNCAERTALFKAVSEGARRFTAVAVVGGPEGSEPKELCPPCGVCRQALREFVDPETFRVVLGAADPAKTVVRTLAELLPESFGPAFLC